MNAISVVILIVLAVIIAFAMYSIIKNKSACKCSGCTGDCSTCCGCSHNG